MRKFCSSSLLFLYFSIAATCLMNVLQDGFHQSSGLLRTVFMSGCLDQSEITVLSRDEKESYLKDRWKRSQSVLVTHFDCGTKRYISFHTFSYILNKGKWFSLAMSRLIKTSFSFHFCQIKDVLGASLTLNIKCCCFFTDVISLYKL